MDALFCYHIVLMLVSTVAFCLLWVGFATPGWLAVTFQEQEAESAYTVSSLNRSLFYDVLCPQELKDCKTCRAGDDSDKCVSDMAFVQYSSHYNWIEQLTEPKEEWVAWRIMMIIVVVAAVVGFIIVIGLVCCLLKTTVYRIMATSGFVAWLIAGLLVWVPVGMVADMHLEIEDTVNNDIPHDATLHVPYSVVIAAFGGFLALVAAFMLLWLTGVCGGRDDMSSESRSDTEVFSNRTKVHSEYIQDGRYYGPYGYYTNDRPAYHREVQPEVYPKSVLSEEVITTENPYYKEYQAGYPQAYGTYMGPTHWYDNRSNMNQNGL